MAASLFGAGLLSGVEGWLGAVLNLVASLPLGVAASASTFVLVDAAGFLAYSRVFVPTVVAPLVLGAAVGLWLPHLRHASVYAYGGTRW